AGLVLKPHTLALARAAHEAARVAEGERQPSGALADAVLIRGNEQVVHAKRGQIGRDVEAEAVAHDLDLAAALADCSHETWECLVLGHRRRFPAEQLRVTR